MRRVYLISLLVAVFLLVGIGNSVAAEDKVIKWKMQSAYPPGDSTYDIFAVNMVKMIERVSNGKVKVDLFQPGALVSVLEMANAVSRGIIDVGIVYGASYAGSVPIADLDAGLPYSWTSSDEQTTLYWDPKYRIVDLMREGWAKKNIFYLTPHPAGYLIFLLNFPVSKVADFRGHKVRASGAIAEWLRLAGASPVVLPGAEIFMAMKLGTIEGTSYTPMILESLKLKEVVKYLIYPPIVNPANVCTIINMDAWNSLPADIRKALTDESMLIKHSLQDEKAYIITTDEAVVNAYKIGIKKVEWPPEEMLKARRLALEVWDKIGSKDETVKKAIDIMKRYLVEKGLL